MPQSDAETPSSDSPAAPSEGAPSEGFAPAALSPAAAVGAAAPFSAASHAERSAVAASLPRSRPPAAKITSSPSLHVAATSFAIESPSISGRSFRYILFDAMSSIGT
jgi:hypothetical protein